MKAFLVVGFAQGAVYGLIALGLALVYKGARVFNFAQGEFGTVAAFVAWLLMERGATGPLAVGLGVAAGLVVTASVGRRLKAKLLAAAGGGPAPHGVHALLHPPVLVHLVGPALGAGVAAGAVVGLLANLVLDRPLGWPLAAAFALGSSVVMGLAVERVVVRPLFNASRVTLLVATAGVALLATALEFILGEAEGRVLRPMLGGNDISLFGVALPPQRLVMLLAVVPTAAFLAWFFSRTNTGLAILGMSQEPLATRLAGIRIKRMSGVVWGLAAGLGGLAGLLQAPIIPFFPGHMTTVALLPGFTAAVLGGITSLGGALVGGFVVGIVQGLGQYFIGETIPGGGDLVVFIVLLGVLLFRPQGLFGKRVGRQDYGSEPAAARVRTPFVPADLVRRQRLVRHGVLAAILGVVLLVPALLPDPWPFQITLAAIFAIIGLSMNVLMGYAGQISLGHQAFVGIGAFTSAILVTEYGQSFWVGMVAAAFTGAVSAAALGLVALRLRGLYLALITLAYGTMAEHSIFGIEGLTRGGAGMPAPRPEPFTGDQAYMYLCFAILGLVIFLDWRFLASKAGRGILAIKQNEAVAASYAIDVTRYKVFAFVLAGIFAGIGGSLFAHWRTTVVDIDFNFTLALTFVLMTVVGGLGSRVGVVIGSAFFALFPVIFSSVTNFSPLWVPLIGAVLLLNTLIHTPGGIGQQVEPLVHWLRGGKVSHGGRHGGHDESAPAQAAPREEKETVHAAP